MLVLRLGPGFRRWLALLCGLALLTTVLRWGLRHDTAAIRLTQAPIARLSAAGPAVALTFDAPGAGAAELATALSAAGLPATVFVSGREAAAQPDEIRALSAAGLEVETLGWSASAPRAATAARLEAELRRAVAAVGADTGAPPIFFRPPAGRYDPVLLRAVERAHLATVTWTARIAAPASATIAAQAAAALQPGAILVLPSTPAGIAALPAIATALRARGYAPVTLDVLLGMAEGAQRRGLTP